MARSNRRTKEQVTRDQKAISDLLAQGKSKREIAKETGRTLTAISLDIRALEGKGLQRSATRVAADRELISVLHVRGWKLADIALELELDISTVHREIKKIEKQWEASPVNNLNALRERISAGFLDVIAQAQEQYENSIGMHVVRKQKYDKDTGEAQPLEIKTEMLRGDPRYLKIISEAYEAWAKLTGANMPVKVAHTDGDGAPIPIVYLGMDPNEL